MHTHLLAHRDQIQYAPDRQHRGHNNMAKVSSTDGLTD